MLKRRTFPGQLSLPTCCGRVLVKRWLVAFVAVLSSMHKARGRSANFQFAVSPNWIRQAVGSVPCGGLSQRNAEFNSAIQRSAAKPQPKVRGSVTRRDFAGHPAFLQILRVGRSQRAAAHRAALRKPVADCNDLDRYP